jgi:hypothetical protein
MLLKVLFYSPRGLQLQVFVKQRPNSPPHPLSTPNPILSRDREEALARPVLPSVEDAKWRTYSCVLGRDSSRSVAFAETSLGAAD